MTGTQLLTQALSIVIPVAMLIYANSRVNEVKGTLRAEIALGNERLLNEIREIKSLFKQHELEHH